MKPTLQFTIIVLLTALIGVGLTGLVFLLRPNASDNVVAIGVIFSFLVSMLSLLKTQETHNIVNSRMDEFKRVLEARTVVEGAAKLSEGYREGRAALASEQKIMPAAPQEKVNIGFLKGGSL